jgi:hypothetical protein
VYTVLNLYLVANLGDIYYTRKNAQVDAILMKTGLNNVLLPTLFIAVNNIQQYCYTRFRLNNIGQYFWKRSGCCNTDENRIEQCLAAHIVHSCQQYSTILLHPIQAQQYCLILLTSLKKRGQQNIVQSCCAAASAFFCRVHINA